MANDNDAPTSAYSAAEALKWAEGNPLSVPIDDEDEGTTDVSVDGKGERTEGKGDRKKGADDDPDHSADPDESEDTDEEEGSKEGLSKEEEDEGDGTEVPDPDSDDEVPELDPLITELAKGNPKAEKRVLEIAKGLQKLKGETKSLRSELEKVRPQAESLDTWNKALMDPATVDQALQQLVVSLAAHHKKTPTDLLPILVPKAPAAPKLDQYGREIPEWEAAGYGSSKEMELERMLVELRGELQGLKVGSEQLQKEREESRKAAEFTALVDKIAPPTITKLEKLENGWKVTRAMVEKAVKELPTWDPVKAVKAFYPDELKAHHAKAVAASRPRKGPEMPNDARGKGTQAPPPSRFSAKDALALVDG